MNTSTPCILKYIAATLLFIALSLSSLTQAEYEPLIEPLAFKQKQAYLLSAQSGRDKPVEAIIKVRKLLATQEPSTLAAIAESEQKPISLEEHIQPQLVRGDLKQFGYDLFHSEPSTFVQVANTPVPENYLIGAGDNIIIQVHGKLNVEYALNVTRNGYLLIPELGPISVAGLSFKDLKATIIHRFKDQLIGAKASVTMGSIKSIQVRLTGEFNRPGTYTVNGLSTLIDALMNSGGIKYSGSLRNISVKRHGRTVATIDLYTMLLHGDTHNDIGLRHNDLIFIPPIQKVVYIGGAVQRPAIYELSHEQHLGQVIALAGGLLPNADLGASHIERIINGQHRTIIDINQSHHLDPHNLAIQNGDFIRLSSVANTMEDIILLSGHVKRPGGYQFTQGDTVADLLLNRNQLMPNTDLDIALLLREHPETRRKSVLYLDLTAIISQPQSTKNVLLQSRDQVHIFNLKPNRATTMAAVVAELDLQASEFHASQTWSIKGHARFTGRFPLQQHSRLLDAIRFAGGILPGTDMNYGLIARNTLFNKVDLFSFSIGAALGSPQSAFNPVIREGDTVYLFDQHLHRPTLMKEELQRITRQTSYLQAHLLVSAKGLVKHAGQYPLEQQMRASDLVCAAGGLTEMAFGLSAELSRYDIINGEKTRLEHLRLSTAQLIALCEARSQQSMQRQQQHVSERLHTFGRMRMAKDGYEVVDIIAPVLFSSGQAGISQAQLDQLHAAIQHYTADHYDVTVNVSGHTDNMPLGVKTSKKYRNNMALSHARANKTALQIATSLHIPKASITTTGLADTRPIASNSTKAGRQLNRRSEISLSITRKGLSNKPQVAKPADVEPLQFSDKNSAYFDNDINPLLKPHDQLTFVFKPHWVDRATVELKGEFVRPGLYVINRGETLCSVVARAGGIRDTAYTFGAFLKRQSVQRLQQKTLNSIQDQLDDLMVELSLSHSAKNFEKTPSGDPKDNYLRVIKQLQRAQPNGRLVINFDKAIQCHRAADIVLENGDELRLPTQPNFVNTAGQLYVPTAHMYRPNRRVEDYVALSGGATVIGRLDHTYVIQANGEVLSLSKRRTSKRIMRTKVQPGAHIIVPLNVDRMNATEKAQSWTRSLFEAAVFAGIVF